MKFKSFEQIISEQNVPRHYHPVELKAGVVELPSNVSSTFKILYRPSGTTKNTGNGEVALYWLFSKPYGGAYEVKRQSGTEYSDFLVNGIPVEVKGWATDIFSGQKIKVGRFEKLHDIRKMLNVIFGTYNVFYAGTYSGEKFGKKSYLSEISFGMNGLTRAFECALLHKGISNVREVIEDKIFDGLTDPSDYAAMTFATMAKKKLSKKVGSNGFIINARPDKIGRLEIMQLGDLNEINIRSIKDEGARVHCSELFLNLTAFSKTP